MKFIKDIEFIRGDVPMTKENIRILTIGKLNIDENSNFLDIGCGSGSITVQGAKLCPKGKVLAIDKDDEAIRVSNENVKKFNCSNVDIIKGEATEILKDIDIKFNSIFIGGSGGNIEELLEKSLNLLLDDGVVVCNFITMKNAFRASEFFEKRGLKTEITLLQSSIAQGKSMMLKANNPIFIMKAEKENI
ncbi:precorrin-6Y C5,15-methyltransferase (decarboxylating) subunit CbiT [Clostridium fallax]|uniref:Cobalt-precorrin 7 C15-methyltransferase n=1 Tax=Clostridium fallax TaxID=1533 RepID=A0A1M4Y2B1_9CLOT|nr:precorrin-6Y C5,15-methyltransferase (decarboxylating) subunit CbiT [Clostridium fallax]SHE99828.1 cobalt-precorrin 7 C15-methyltransferase [Clostridium fallax]SQB07783.1 precorrin-6y C5,15-methyltransferase subunit CbiT [Clostridium fallax]